MTDRQEHDVMTKPLYRCWTKATNREEGEPRRSLNWVRSRRAWFEVYEDRIECGDWTIPTSAVQDAVLYEARQFLIPARVLSVEAAGVTYQFGFNPWCRAGQHLPFDVRNEKIKLGRSPFSIVVRLILLVYLIYLVLTTVG